MFKPEVSENVKKLAEQIVNYETHEKGVMGSLFAFEARDGFLSKLVKTLGSTASTLAGGLATFAAVSGLVTGGAGLAVAGVAAVAVGLISGAIHRAAYKSIFSDLHDSHKGNLGKFGHYLGTGLVIGLARSAINVLAPGLGTLAEVAISSAVFPLVGVIASKGIASGFGDQQLLKESEVAKQIAQQAIQSGQSVEQLLDRGKPAQQVVGHAMSESPEQTQEKTRDFTKMIEQQRINQQQLSIT